VGSRLHSCYARRPPPPIGSERLKQVGLIPFDQTGLVALKGNGGAMNGTLNVLLPRDAEANTLGGLREGSASP
jgi:hypothetical protein